MQDFLRLLVGMAVLVANLIGGLALGIWALALGDPSTKKTSSWLLSVMFWPLLPLISKITERVRSTSGRGGQVAGLSASDDAFGRRFATIRAAKDCLVGRIAAEADRECVPLTEVERKMLYFSETGWTLPEMRSVSKEFDRSYDQNEYEKRISALVRSIEARDSASDGLEQRDWDAAAQKLSTGDHYLSVLMNIDSQESHSLPRWLRLLIASLAFFLIAFVDIRLKQWFLLH